MKRLLLAIYGVLPWRLLNRWAATSERRRLLDQALERRRNRMCGRVLEIGAGNNGRRGRFRPPTEHVEAWWTLDLRFASGPDIAADVCRLPLSSCRFDTVVCLEVLEYIPDVAQAILEMARVTAPGGILLLSTPFLHRADSPEDQWRFTEKGLRQLIDDNGFRVEFVEAQGAALLVVANILKFAVHRVPLRVLRILLAGLAVPLIMGLRGLDQPMARWIPDLARFSTGYLALARRTME